MANMNPNTQQNSGNNNSRGGNNQGNRRPQFNRGPRQDNNNRRERDNEPKLFSEIIELKRVAKVTAGAKRLRFSTVVAVGNKNGKIGIAMGRGSDPQESLQKATRKANDSLINIRISRAKKTIPHRVEAKYKSSRVLIKPAPVGTGIVAGGSVRKILELAGIENVVSKSLGTNNAITNAYCAIVALSNLKQVSHVSRVKKAAKEE